MHTNVIEGEYSSISAQGGSKKDLKNYRPVAIINVVCKLFMMVLREIIKLYVEESGMLGDIQVV